MLEIIYLIDHRVEIKAYNKSEPHSVDYIFRVSSLIGSHFSYYKKKGYWVYFPKGQTPYGDTILEVKRNLIWYKPWTWKNWYQIKFVERKNHVN